ncbi:ubiquitin-like domain-containing CTD phosphatase 1 [Littorina saxatilis]|uniref:FCP1 homology domain-containing protein n=1 Tax=Littorina saxatilis TaxID=31220 RepID=A0AAN9GKA9_9CAEN
MAADVGDLIVKFSKKEYKICGLSGTDTISDLKNAIHNQTGVLPEHQKLAGFKVKVGQYNDSSQLSSMMLKPNMKLTLIGTRADVIAEVREPPPDLPEVINDFDIEDEVIALENREEYLAKVQRRIKDYKVTLLNPFRENKKLLVLDIDYTLFDHRSTAETPNELMRPYLHEFLKAAYEDYDIGIWSATSMRWIEAKLKILGVTNNPEYKICFHLDYDAMISVHTPKYGVIEVKPLGVLWGKFPEWSEKNTIMFDDIRRNFIMNPNNGLRIRAFRDAHTRRATDRELLKLSEYLRDIADLDDFSRLDHREWQSYRRKAPRKSKATSERKSSQAEGRGESGAGE